MPASNLTVVLTFEKEAYRENSHNCVLHCHIELAFLLIVYVFGS